MSNQKGIKIMVISKIKLTVMAGLAFSLFGVISLPSSASAQVKSKQAAEQLRQEEPIDNRFEKEASAEAVPIQAEPIESYEPKQEGGDAIKKEDYEREAAEVETVQTEPIKSSDPKQVGSDGDQTTTKDDYREVPVPALLPGMALVGGLTIARRRRSKR